MMHILSGVGGTVKETPFLGIFLSISHTETQKSITAVCHTSCHSTEKGTIGITPVEMIRCLVYGVKGVGLPTNCGFSIFNPFIARSTLLIAPELLHWSKI